MIDQNTLNVRTEQAVTNQLGALVLEIVKLKTAVEFLQSEVTALTQENEALKKSIPPS